MGRPRYIIRINRQIEQENDALCLVRLEGCDLATGCLSQEFGDSPAILDSSLGGSSG